MRVRGENGVQQAGEAAVEVLAAKRVELGCALDALLDHAGLAQDAEVVRERRLGDVEIEAAAAARRGFLGQRANDAEALRVAEGVQHCRQLDVLCHGMELHYELIIRRPSYFGTMVVVLANQDLIMPDPATTSSAPPAGCLATPTPPLTPSKLAAVV